MAAIAARVGRAVLAVAAVVFAVVAVGLQPNPHVPGWLIGACAVLAFFAGCLAYVMREVRRAPLVGPQSGAITVPGGRLAARFSWESRDLENVVVYPNDGRGPLRLGTLTVPEWGQLVHAETPAALRSRAYQLGGVR